VDVSIKAKRLQLVSFTLLCNKNNHFIFAEQHFNKIGLSFYVIVNISYLTTSFNESNNHCKVIFNINFIFLR